MTEQRRLWADGDPRPRDLEQGRRRGVVGMALAAASNPEWAVRAKYWIFDQPPGFEFVADDMTDAIGIPTRTAAIGSAIMAASRRRWIERTGEVRPSRVETSNASMVSVWRRRGQSPGQVPAFDDDDEDG